MKTFSQPLSLFCLVGSMMKTYADTSVSRKLQGGQNPGGKNPGEFCLSSAKVECRFTDDGSDCKSLGVQPYQTCGSRLVTFSYTFCNRLKENNIMPLRENPDGEPGTQAMYRQRFGTPSLLLGTLGPDVCRETTITEEVDTCKKRVVGELKFEGWVDGRTDEDGYYCYAFDFLEVPFFQAPQPPVAPPTPTPEAEVSLIITCKHTDSNTDCARLSVSDVSFDDCTVGITYKYTVVNMSTEHDINIGALVDESLVSIIGDSDITIEGGEERIFEKHATINICEVGGSTIKKKALVVANPVGAGRAGDAADELTFEAPSLPFNLYSDGAIRDHVVCEINDGSGRDCNAYLKTITQASQCYVTIMFKYSFTNFGKGCVSIKGANADVGPLGLEVLTFEDKYSCGADRVLCEDESMTIPDRRFVNLCEVSQHPRNWDIDVEVSDKLNRKQEFTYTYNWDAFTLTVMTLPPIVTFPPVPQIVRKECEGRPSKIEFQIIPISCDQSDNSLKTLGRKLKSKKSGSYFQCDGSVSDSITPLYVEISNTYDKVLLEKTRVVDSNSILTLTSVPTNVNVKIYHNNNVVQNIVFHASCSKPIFTGDSFGSFKIVEFVY